MAWSPVGVPASGLVEPDVLEAVEERGRVLLEAPDGILGEVDALRREEPEVWHVLQDQDLHLVVDLLALLLIHSAPALLEEGVDLWYAPGVPVLPLDRVQGAEERRVGIGVA